MPDYKWIPLLQRMSPEAIDVLEKRYRILRQIRLLQPVGRRLLADVLESTERVIRREVDFLREQRLIDTNRAGMFVTADGEEMLVEFHPLWKEIGGIGYLEQEMERRLNIRRVIIVPGDADESEWVKDDMARHAADELISILDNGVIAAVAGGTSVARVADHLRPVEGLSGITFVPARGALGEEVDIQSNTIAARMARRLDASYRLLHIPDVMEEEIRRNLKRDPVISEVLEQIDQATVLIHGIGEAVEMSRRRGLNTDIIHILQESKAVSEVFGYYFDRTGKLVYRMSTMGIQMEKVEKLDTVLAVAGGRSKAEAILSYIENRPNYVLVTDEAAMRELLAWTAHA